MTPPTYLFHPNSAIPAYYSRHNSSILLLLPPYSCTFIHPPSILSPHIFLSVPFHSCIVFTHALHSISSPLVHALLLLVYCSYSCAAFYFFPLMFMRYSHSWTTLIYALHSSFSPLSSCVVLIYALHSVSLSIYQPRALEAPWYDDIKSWTIA